MPANQQMKDNMRLAAAISKLKGRLDALDEKREIIILRIAKIREQFALL